MNDFSRTVPMTQQLIVALRAGVTLLVLCGLIYTGSVTLLGGMLFPKQATGSLIQHEGRLLGSTLVAQPFVSPGYFYSRPSAAGYDPTITGGSNLAPGNPALRERVEAESVRIQALEGVSASAIPVDLLAASGGGLDPHITPESAQLQGARVAAARGVSIGQVLELIDQQTEGPQWGLFGQPRVNVLSLNLALDALESSTR